MEGKGYTDNDTESKFYTTKEVAEMFKVSVSTIQRYCRDGLLPYVKTGRFIRVKAEYIDGLLK